MKDIDDAIRKLYVDFDTPADAIVGNPAVATKFAAAVKAACADAAEMEVEAIYSRLLNLRRRGADNGGLPRLRYPSRR